MGFFERYLSIWVAGCMVLGVAIALFGLASPVALVTIVGVLVEVPVMILLVRYANKTRSLFE